MTQEDKKLLLKDLSARLPYGVFCSMGLDYPLPLQRLFINKLDGTLLDFYEDGKDYQVYLSEVKPYLRPMSSMTEEEKRELSSKYNWNIKRNDISIRYHSEGYWDDDTECPTNEYLNLFDWLNTHRFDYRGLIERGLAIEVTEENNPYK